MPASHNKLIAAIAVNALVVVLEIIAMVHGIQRHGVAGNFMYYTECSNLLGGIACALCLVEEVGMLRGDAVGGNSNGNNVGMLRGNGGNGNTSGNGAGADVNRQLSRPLSWLKYASSCCLLMTLFVVTFVLAPMLNSVGRDGYYLMFIDGVKLITHLGAPLLVTGSYILFESDRDMTLRQSLVGFVPTLVYAAVAYPCNIARVWVGPYPFFQVWDMPVWQSIAWFVALFALSFALCQVPRLLSRIAQRST